MIGLVPLAAACGGSGPPPTMQGREGMLSKTAIAQKCEEAAKGHDRPFVIEWDATDLASFEALAHRDTVVVKYQGCDIQVLDRCSDAAAAGHFGAYGQPTFTSGTVQGFDIGNEGELYAKLPLGAASLSGKVSAGENLHLKYFVSGVATSSRDALYSNDIAKIPGCAGATHFVWGYNLGAFELNSAAHNAEEAHAGFGNIGAGGTSGHQESSLANGGSMASCTTNDQRSCRVPIRLVLRAITDGDSPAVAPGGPIVTVNGQSMTMAQLNDPAFRDTTPTEQARRMAEEARKRMAQGDGQGCVDLFDKAANLDAQYASINALSHARCQMMAGHCDVGKTELRQEIGRKDPNRNKTDDQITAEVDGTANRDCPAATAATPAEFVLRASHEMEAADKANDGKRCLSLANKIEEKMALLQRTNRDDMVARGSGQSSIARASTCVAGSVSCDAGGKLYGDWYRGQFSPNSKQDFLNKESASQWATKVKNGTVKCQ